MSGIAGIHGQGWAICVGEDDNRAPDIMEADLNGHVEVLSELPEAESLMVEIAEVHLAPQEVLEQKVPQAEAPAGTEIAATTSTEVQVSDKEALPSQPIMVEDERRRQGPMRMASVNGEIRREPIRLRKLGRDLSAEDIMAVLQKYNFYATCWNYNAHFCNPEGDFENHFVDNRNGTITDASTGLVWQKGGSSGAMTWTDAKAYVIQLNTERFAGYADWRLPTVEELASLMENSWESGDLFIAQVFDLEQRQCWTADTNRVNRAWKANFHLGFFIDFPMTVDNSVRAVRSLSPAEVSF
jgi:hypothetical protein